MLIVLLVWGAHHSNAQIPEGLPLAMHQPFGGPGLSLSYTSTFMCQSGYAVDLTVTGGTPPYQYAWSNGTSIFSNQEDIVMNSGGEPLSVAVYDQFGNYSVIEIDAGMPAMITDAPCSGPASGAIDITPPPGLIDPQFRWYTGNDLLATTEDVSGLAPGEYLLNLFESPPGTCSTFAFFTVNSLPAITGTVTVSPNGWNCQVGAIDLTPSGGTAPYSFAWAQGQTTEDLQNMNGGFYSVVITDALGCTGTRTNIFLPNAPVMQLSATSTSTPVCGAVGTIDLSVSGGVPPYSYSWSPQASTDEDRSGLYAGEHHVVVTDATGCTASALFTVEGTASTLAYSGTITAPCAGGHNGAVDLTVTGGNAPYSFSWSGPNGSSATTEDIADLASGNHHVVVQDASGCFVIASFQLIGTQPLVLSATPAPTCSNTGALDLTATGTDGPFGFVWSNGSTSEDLTGVPQNTYTVEVTDLLLGCETMGIFSIGQATPPSVDDYVLSQDCNGSDVDVTTSGGTAPYAFHWQWDQGNGTASVEDLTDVASGSYSFVVVDAAGCANFLSVEVPPGPALEISLWSWPACNSTIQQYLTGGTGPFSYAWSNGGTTADLPGVTPGETYSVTVQDQGGLQCTATATYTMPNVQPIEVSAEVTPACYTGEGATNGSIDITVTGATGEFTYAWYGPGGGLFSTDQDVFNLTPGIYYVLLGGDYAYCGIAGFYSIAVSPAMTLNAISIPTCNAGMSGSIDITVSGGTSPFTYQWSGPGGFSSSVQDPTGLAGGTYTVAVTDGAGCTRLRSVIVGNTVIELDHQITDAACSTVQLGAIAITATEGVAPYSYAWSNGATSEDVTDLPVGAYTVIVQDANGCSSQQIFEIIDSSPCCQAAAFVPHGTLASGGMDGFSGTVDIQGEYIVDANTSFDNANVTMEPGAEIIVKNGATLDIRNTSITSCSGTMWRSITVESGGTLYIARSFVDDAENAVMALDGAVVSLRDNQFHNNRVAVQVPVITGVPVNSVSLVSHNNQFYSAGTMPQPYPGQATPVGNEGYAAFEVNRMQLDLTTGWNVMHHLSNGIVADRCDVTVRDCAFHYLQPDAAYALLGNGSAIHVDAPAGWHNLDQVGSFITGLPPFRECRWGVYARRMNVTSSANTMEQVGTAYHMEKCGLGRTVHLFNNTLDTKYDGIELLFNDGAWGLLVEDNTITFATNPPPGQSTKGYTAIRVEENNGMNGGSVIRNNTITFRSGVTTAHTGIKLTAASDYLVAANTIT
ncbi:MAG: SprB repeat-containing protein [Flavobacteriales bacterium]|nr:SprB repeat-containing protein [Flavobacteriales bacterium]